MNIYESTTTDFDNNGKGYLTDCLSDMQQGNFQITIEEAPNIHFIVRNNTKCGVCTRRNNVSFNYFIVMIIALV